MKAKLDAEGKSEVAALRQRIEQEYEAAQSGLFGLAQGTARHAWITARTERLAEAYARLCDMVGPGQATTFLLTVERQQDGQEERKAEMNHETGRTPPRTD
jgi:hypothetical protein